MGRERCRDAGYAAEKIWASAVGLSTRGDGQMENRGGDCLSEAYLEMMAEILDENLVYVANACGFCLSLDWSNMPSGCGSVVLHFGRFHHTLLAELDACVLPSCQFGTLSTAYQS